MAPTDITPNSNHAGVERLDGFSIRESAGSPAVAAFNLRKASAVGQILFVGELQANESATLMLHESVSSEGGLYVEVTAGTISGVLWGS